MITLLGIAGLMRALRNAPVPAAEPTPAPVGTDRLAYGLHGDIYLADANGENPVRIANGIALNGRPGNCRSYWGEGAKIWSPDGRYLAFLGEVGRGGSCQRTVNIADAAGGIVASFPGEGWKIAWSPDFDPRRHVVVLRSHDRHLWARRCAREAAHPGAGHEHDRRLRPCVVGRRSLTADSLRQGGADRR